jgi:hypothetical protein
MWFTEDPAVNIDNRIGTEDRFIRAPSRHLHRLVPSRSPGKRDRFLLGQWDLIDICRHHSKGQPDELEKLASAW